MIHCEALGGSMSNGWCRCSLDTAHRERGEHHFSIEGEVEWPCYSADPAPAHRISVRRSEVALWFIGDGQAPGGQLA